jgi:SAM-dependent methyltransferase
VSWYQPEPAASLRLITQHAPSRDSPVLDVGDGASHLAGRLSAAGFTDVSVLDVSADALAVAAQQPDAKRAHYIHADILTWRPTRAYQVWHDRAVFHFLNGATDRETYLAAMREALPDGGAIILATFATDGPDHCSGLPVARYDADELAGELERAFGADVTVNGHETEVHHTPTGVVQPFTWLTARLRTRTTHP